MYIAKQSDNRMCQTTARSAGCTTRRSQHVCYEGVERWSDTVTKLLSDDFRRTSLHPSATLPAVGYSIVSKRKVVLRCCMTRHGHRASIVVTEGDVTYLRRMVLVWTSHDISSLYGR